MNSPEPRPIVVGFPKGYGWNRDYSREDARDEAAYLCDEPDNDQGDEE